MYVTHELSNLFLVSIDCSQNYKDHTSTVSTEYYDTIKSVSGTNSSYAQTTGHMPAPLALSDPLCEDTSISCSISYILIKFCR